MRKPSSQTRTVTAAVALAAALTAGAAPAMAVESPKPTQSAGDQRFCWLNADTDRMQCFGTEAAMTEAMQQGASTGQIAPQSSAPLLQSRSFQAKQQVVGRFYRDINFGGGYLMISRSGGCGTGFHAADLSNYPGWNDTVSSFVAGSGCRIGIFDNSNLTGDFHGNYRSDAYVGYLNDRASSAHFVAD